MLPLEGQIWLPLSQQLLAKGTDVVPAPPFLPHHSSILQFFTWTVKAEHDLLVVEHKGRGEALICSSSVQDSRKSWH